MARVLPLLLVACLEVFAAGDKSLEGYHVYRLLPTRRDQIEWVRGLHQDSALDFWSSGDVMVGPERQQSFLEQLTCEDIAYETLITDVQKTIDDEKTRQLAVSRDGLGRGMSFTNYYRYTEIQAYLEELAQEYPDIVTVSSIGMSFEGRSLPLVKISAGGHDNRSIILIDAGIHAREWIAPSMALYIIQQLVENPANADLIANVEWHIIPLLNPDGYEYSHTQSRLWLKTRSLNSCSTVNSGVDANRNFAFFWKDSNNPCSNSNSGTRPFSEPETAALRDYVLGKANIKLYLTLHSYGSNLLYPWAHTTQLPSDWEALDALAQQANAAQMAVSGNSYTIGSYANILGEVGGTSADWVKGEGGVDLCYTIELPGGGSYGFDLPASAIANTVSNFWPAVRVFGEHVAKL